MGAARDDARPPAREQRLSKRREVSSIVGITPDGRLAARHVPGAITSAVVVWAIRYFLRRFGPRLLLVWDRLNAHRSRETQTFLAAHPEVAVAYLPAYAPELNPEEQCNNGVKQDMLHALPASLDDLLGTVRGRSRRLQHHPDVLAHFFAHAGLRC